MIDIKHEVLRYVAMCEEVAVISGPRALATLKSTENALANVGTAYAVKELHQGKFIAVSLPRKPKSAVRFILTQKGRDVLSGARVAA